MSLSGLLPRWLGERRARRWTVATLAAVVVGTGALGTAGVRSFDPDAGAAAAGPSGTERAGTSQNGLGARQRKHHSCPSGAVPAVVVDEVRTQPAPIGGIWLRPGMYRVVVRGHLANDTDAAITVGGVRATIGDRPWRPRARWPRSLAAESTGRVILRGAFRSPSRQRLAVATHLSWGWRGPPNRACGVSGLAEDD
jgi:hypothetical protein